MSYRDYINQVGLSSETCIRCKRAITNPSFFYNKKHDLPMRCFACSKAAGIIEDRKSTDTVVGGEATKNGFPGQRATPTAVSEQT